jgi:hypothetical protein
MVCGAWGRSVEISQTAPLGSLLPASQPQTLMDPSHALLPGWGVIWTLLLSLPL